MKQRKSEKSVQSVQKTESQKKIEVKARRLKVAELMLRGFTLWKMAQEIGANESTVRRDLVEIKRGRIEETKKAIAQFDLGAFWQERLERIAVMRQELWRILESPSDHSRVGAIRELRVLDEEEERVLNKLGIETSRMSPEKVAGNLITFYEDLGSDPNDQISQKRE